MSTWEYRAVRIPSPHGDTVRLAEVYYGDDLAIEGWAFASGPQGDSREDLQAELRHMVEAASRDILPAETLPGWQAFAATGVDDTADLVAD